MRFTRPIGSTIVAVLLLAGCTNLPYYLQSVRGQLDVWSRQHDIQSVIADPNTPQELRSKLQTVLGIRDFATAELALPQNSSYRTYANL